VSLDVYLTTETTAGGSEPRREHLYERNITHNMSKMWNKAGVWDALYESHGKQAKDIIATLENGVADMAMKKGEYLPLNPENGWGSYEGALDFLSDYLAACKEYPLATIGVSR
jgi:hypothetical protein